MRSDQNAGLVNPVPPTVQCSPVTTTGQAAGVPRRPPDTPRTDHELWSICAPRFSRRTRSLRRRLRFGGHRRRPGHPQSGSSPAHGLPFGPHPDLRARRRHPHHAASPGPCLPGLARKWPSCATTCAVPGTPLVGYSPPTPARSATFPTGRTSWLRRPTPSTISSPAPARARHRSHVGSAHHPSPAGAEVTTAGAELRAAIRQSGSALGTTDWSALTGVIRDEIHAVNAGIAYLRCQTAVPLRPASTPHRQRSSYQTATASSIQPLGLDGDEVMPRCRQIVVATILAVAAYPAAHRWRI